MNIKNYINYYKNISFADSPFNDIDNILFSLIVYLDFKDIVTQPISIKDAGEKYFLKENKKSGILLIRKTIQHFKLLYDSPRYKDVILSNYVKIVDDEKQFCALTYHLPDGTIYIAYEGTDDTMIGWQEDCEMLYKFPIPSQELAIEYINKIVRFGTKKVLVGGHSKGGNLAMTAGMYAKGYVRNKIVTIYNNDGPGFRKEQFESKEYKQMLPRLRMFVPEETIIGFILNHSNNYTVVKSSSKGFFQHNPNNWHCCGSFFVGGTLSSESKRLESRMAKWVRDHDIGQREQFVTTLFDTFKKCDITLFSQLRQFKVARFVKLIRVSRSLDRESKDLIFSFFRMLFFNSKQEKNTLNTNEK